MISNDKTPRRGFLGTMAAAAAAVTLPWTGKRVAAAQGGPDDWIAQQTGEHRALFDFPAAKAGSGLVHIRNYILTYGGAYGVDPSDISTIGTFYSLGRESSIPMAFNDAMWEKYAIGEYIGLGDPATMAPATRNMYNADDANNPVLYVGPIGPFPDARIESLQEMGTTFLLCNNALVGWSMELAGAGRGEAEAIQEDLKANTLPGVILVPAMVISIEKAQAAGITYNKQ
jgi:intracellular sulfur oxidation DsrE/DsrF family protein